MTTYFLHLLTVCGAIGGEPRTCITYAVENRALCEAGMQIAYADLFPEDRGVYISCEQTRVLTSTIRPRGRP